MLLISKQTCCVDDRTYCTWPFRPNHAYMYQNLLESSNNHAGSRGLYCVGMIILFSGSKATTCFCWSLFVVFSLLFFCDQMNKLVDDLSYDIKILVQVPLFFTTHSMSVYCSSEYKYSKIKKSNIWRALLLCNDVIMQMLYANTKTIQLKNAQQNNVDRILCSSLRSNSLSHVSGKNCYLVNL